MTESVFDRRSLLAGMAAISLLGVIPAVGQSADSELLSVKTAAGRAVAVHRWSAAGLSPRGRILFSHGALSAPWKYLSLINAWTQAGYEVLAPLHVDSTDHPDRAAFQGMASWPARIEDVRAVADHIGGPYIAAGHSYGALVALCLGGAGPKVPETVKTPLRDPRATAVVAFSPPGGGMGLVNQGDYAGLAVPALIQTGDRDVPPGGNADWRSHLLAYDDAAAGGNRYALVLAGVDHYFGGGICRPELPGPKQEAALSIAASLSILFMRAHGGGDQGALQVLRSRLATDGPAILTLK
ncbi:MULTISPECIES: alpha/beta fold hydrolase [unclassified Azospirillum]|uniref:alpha/beta hydrolase family protein n=1 Tax=unclassified Azospirillum TaxID=2630922 RepID=UPI000B6420BC|nr:MULTISPECIES: alpha/beta fold hydrolase [unclassified Azospirillum]SNS15315.1 Alpha/beta hydrolase family protein [Azospirillum sp. RU38E]SNS32577.1 Alpha/beta hydrolase family protein [Azospirillum sp. RU37A]